MCETLVCGCGEVVGSHISTYFLFMLLIPLQSSFTSLKQGLIIITYAYIGIIFFGKVKRGIHLNQKVNFDDFRNAMFLLIRIMTGEDWNSLMHDVCLQPPYCDDRPKTNYWENNCGNRPLAYIYFHTFTVIITYFLFNVLTGEKTQVLKNLHEHDIVANKRAG